MTSSTGAESTWRTIFSRRMLIALAMGFAAGLPLLLTLTLLQAWMTAEGVDLGTIGLFGLVGLPYTLKFLWAPILDRYLPPILGRRRGWLLITQLFVAAAILLLSGSDPIAGPLGVVAASLMLTFFSASQDIAIDAYRRETLGDDEQGLGAAYYVYGYRIATMLTSGGGLILADIVSFQTVYRIMAAAMVIPIATTLFAREPERVAGTPQTLFDAVFKPFAEYFSRQHAWLLLLFIVMFKVGDMVANHMSIPFYLQIGFTNSEIGTIVKVFGVWATLLGVAIGGIASLKIGLYRSLWAFGILQAVSTAGFVVLANVGPDRFWLAAVISFENLSMGMGTAALTGFMAVLTDRKFTATQFALLSSLASIPRVILAAPSGYLAEAVGWPVFFSLCVLIAIPGLLLLLVFRNWDGIRRHD